MAENRRKKLQPVDLIGIANLLEHLVSTDTITYEERDKIKQRIAKDNNLTEHMLPALADRRRSKSEVLDQALYKGATESQYHRPNESYISLTEIVRAHSEDSPGYVIQSWLRSGNALAFLNLWEKENNPDYYEGGYQKLLEKKKAASFTLTPNLWICQTNAIGIMSRQGKSGGTFAHPMIACEFAAWLTPEFKILLLKLSLDRNHF